MMVLMDISDRVKAERTMIKSEMQYRTLFESIDEGYCILEVLFDENQDASDFRFLQINPAFADQTGLGDVRGKRMREVIPAFEDYWFSMCGRVALTGQSERFQNRVEQLDRWYEGCAFRIGAPEQRQVAVLFNDISEHQNDDDDH